MKRTEEAAAKPAQRDLDNSVRPTASSAKTSAHLQDSDAAAKAVSAAAGNGSSPNVSPPKGFLLKYFLKFLCSIHRRMSLEIVRRFLNKFFQMFLFRPTKRLQLNRVSSAKLPKAATL